MRRITIIAATAVAVGGVSGNDVAGDTAVAKTSTIARPACGAKCRERVQKRVVRRRWWETVRAYGVGLLRARMRCESGSSGGYSLSTTGNGYWFAHQFDVAAWTGAGGRMRHGRPAGVWTTQPSRLEQDVRIIRWERIHGGDPNPNCP